MLQPTIQSKEKNNNIASITCDVVSFNDRSRTTLSANLYRVKRSFKPYQNEQDLVKMARGKGKKPCKVDPKIHENLETRTTKLFITRQRPQKPLDQLQNMFFGKITEGEWVNDLSEINPVKEL